MSVPAPKLDKPVDKIDVGKALEMRLVHGHTYQHIADHFDCSPQAVEQRISAFKATLLDPELQRVVEDNRGKVYGKIADVLAFDLLDTSKRESASLNNVAYAANVAYNISRIASGLSTSNVSIADTASRLADSADKVANEIAKLEGVE